MTHRKCLQLAVNSVKADLNIATPSRTKYKREYNSTYLTIKTVLIARIDKHITLRFSFSHFLTINAKNPGSNII